MIIQLLINRYKTPNPAKEPYKFIRKLVEIGKFLKNINNQKVSTYRQVIQI